MSLSCLNVSVDSQGVSSHKNLFKISQETSSIFFLPGYHFLGLTSHEEVVLLAQLSGTPPSLKKCLLPKVIMLVGSVFETAALYVQPGAGQNILRRLRGRCAAKGQSGAAAEDQVRTTYL